MSGNGVTLTALLRSEIRRLASRRVLRWTFAVIVGVMLAVVVVAVVRSTGSPGDPVMRLGRLWGSGNHRGNHDAVLQLSVYVFLAVVGIAATAVGADFRAGTIGTILAWEPRRIRVAVVRLTALAVVAAAFTGVILGIFSGTWALGAALRGTTGVESGFWSGLAQLVARCAAGAALLAVLTGAVAFLTRNTVGAMFAWFGYLVAVEGVLASRVDGLRVSLLLTNFGAFVSGVAVETGGRQRVTAGGLFTVDRYFAMPGPGALRVLVVVVAAAALAVLMFRRRDVT